MMRKLTAVLGAARKLALGGRWRERLLAPDAAAATGHRLVLNSAALRSLAISSDGPVNPVLNLLFATLHPNNPAEAISREQAVIA